MTPARPPLLHEIDSEHSPLQERPEAIFFDMDGVLVDSEELHWETVQDVLRARLGESAPRLPARIGWGDVALWSELKVTYSLEASVQSLIDERDEWAIKRLKETPPPPILYAISTLKRWRLEAPDLPLAVVSASPRSQMTQSLTLFIDDRGESLFDLMISGVDDVRENKPAPMAYHYAAERLGVEMKRSWVAEDSSTGLTAALASGASVFSINAQHAREELLARCQQNLNNLQQLYDLWQKLADR